MLGACTVTLGQPKDLEICLLELVWVLLDLDFPIEEPRCVYQPNHWLGNELYAASDWTVDKATKALEDANASASKAILLGPFVGLVDYSSDSSG